MTELPVEWAKQAQTDLRSIFDFIFDDSPEAAWKLLEDIRRKAAQLSDHPKLYKIG